MNKNILATLAASCALGTIASAQLDTADISISSTVGFESEYVFRGVQLAGNSLQASVELNVAGAYVGVWTNQAIRQTVGGNIADNEVDFYVGYSFAATDLVELDVGATYYYFPESAADKSIEGFIGATFDTFLSPSLYVFRDFDLKTWTVEGSVGHTIDLADVAPGVSFEVGGTLGWVSVKNGDDYLYVGGTADLKYSFTDNASASIGVRLTKNDIDRVLIANRENFWFGFSFTAGF